MRDVAQLSWGTVAALFGAVVAILLIDGLLSDGPLLSETALVSLPIVAVIVSATFAVIRRRYRQ